MNPARTGAVRRWTYSVPRCDVARAPGRVRADRPHYRRAAVALACLASLAAAGCRFGGAGVARPPAPIAPSLSPFRHVMQARALPAEPGRAQLRANMIASVRERLMSHRDIGTDARRMTETIQPIVEEAALQPEAQPGLTAFARDAGISVAEARRQWIRLQTADIMLESGGDPDAVSSSAAVGAAQWLAGTARGVGLPVDLPASTVLSARITRLRCRIAWIRYLGRPDANRAAPGAAAFPPEGTQALPLLEAQLESLREARRRVDARYDPRRAIFAQTRYLMRIYRRFPSPDWLFQAYHGGEAGVTKTLRLYEGSHWTGSAEAAIRTGAGGSRLTFDTLYFTTSPTSHVEAFSYLFSRSDDHRHYWYKLLAADQTLDAYRKSPEAFHAAWQTHLPGRRIEAYWYPDAASGGISSIQDLRGRRDLEPITPGPGLQVRSAADDPANAALYARLAPGARGVLALVVGEYQMAGGNSDLTTGDLTLTQEYVDHARVLHPAKPAPLPLFPPDPDAEATAGGGPPRRFDYHTTGLVFDILRPADDPARKILEYTLDRMEAQGMLAAIQAKDRGERRFHVVPHPAYASVFAQIAATIKPPAAK